MASNSSGDLAPGESYTLGLYTFSISSQYDSSVDTTYIAADCSYGEDAGVKQTTVEDEVEIESWHVECSDDAADVYATVHEVKRRSEYVDGSYYKTKSSIGQLFPITNASMRTMGWEALSADAYLFPRKALAVNGMTGTSVYLISEEPGAKNYKVVRKQSKAIPNTSPRAYEIVDGSYTASESLNNSITHDGETAYYLFLGTVWEYDYKGETLQVAPEGNERVADDIDEEMIWSVLYGSTSDQYGDPEEVFVARFAIDIDDADPESWDDPIDDGDPEMVLKLTVRGALSGRHNDPIYDTSYSYTPADNPTEKDYGCGGDGGYGGGGGAGASTVIINKFATSQAGSHETYAYARRHGYGSGGGKGGRGGDGCIIIYW